MAWGTPEVQAAGQPALLAFRRAGYPNLYRTEVPDDRVEGGVVTTYGWRTTKSNRHGLIITWIMYCRRGAENLPNNTHRIIVRSKRIATEEETFYINKAGKPEHKPGFHDDCMFGAMIALQVHLRCPRQIRRPFEPERRQAQITDKPAYSWADGHDPGILAQETGAETTG